MSRPLREPDIEAEIRFLPTVEGGRMGPVRTGYRPDHNFGLEGMLNGAHHEFVDRDWVALGERVVTQMWFTVPEYQTGRLAPGFEFTIQEGNKIVGRGQITVVLNPALARTDKDDEPSPSRPA